MDINNDLNTQKVNSFNGLSRKVQQKMEKPKDYGLQEDKFEKQVEDDDVREEPNFAITQADLGGMRMFEVEYYPEDIEKMKHMTADEIREYKKYLLKNDRYIL